MPSRNLARWLELVLAAGLLMALASPGVAAGRAAEVRKKSFELLNQGVTAYKNGDYAVAVEKLEQSASMALNSFRAHFYLGLARIGDRRYTDAVEALGVALDLDPNHLQSLAALGDAYLKLGDVGEANAAFYRALKLRAEYPAALDGLARVYESQGKDDLAVEHYLRAIHTDRGFAPAYTHLGDLYLRSGRFEDAVELLEEAVSVRPDFAAGLNRLALAYGRLGLSNEAVATIQKAMELEPKNAAHPATLGELQLAQGALAAAEGSFAAALELDHAQPDAMRGMAEVARRRGEYDEALEWLDEALADPRLEAGRAVRMRRFRGEIVAEQQRAVELAARVADGEATSEDFAQLAMIHARRGQWEEATRWQRRVETSREQRERLAYMLFRAKQFREAHGLYRELAAETGSAELTVNDGVALAMLGDDREAVAAYRRALDIDPANAAARVFLGNAWLRLGDSAAAVAAYKAFLDGGAQGERAERVRRILAQIAPEALPPKASPLEPPPAPPVEPAGQAQEGDGS